MLIRCLHNSTRHLLCIISGRRMPYPYSLVQKGKRMTTFGHSLTGMALLTLIIPERLSWLQRLLWIIAFIAISNIPDWPLPIWGHRQLAISHSLWVNLSLYTTLAALVWRYLPEKIEKPTLLMTVGLAWLSHIGLDTLYGDLPGVVISWPFSDGMASFPLPWLKTLPHVPPPFDFRVIKILFFEFITFSPLILLAYGLRRIRLI